MLSAARKHNFIRKKITTVYTTKILSTEKKSKIYLNKEYKICKKCGKLITNKCHFH